MSNNSSKMPQSSVNERLKFLIESLNLSARAFSSAIGVPDSNTRNYLSKGTKLNSDYLESIASHFSHVNLGWLITGQGEPFVNDEPNQMNQTNMSGKKNSVNVAGNNSGTAIGRVGKLTLDECQRDLVAANEKITLLTSQLADKERTIQILLKQQP